MAVRNGKELRANVSGGSGNDEPENLISEDANNSIELGTDSKLLVKKGAALDKSAIIGWTQEDDSTYSFTLAPPLKISDYKLAFITFQFMIPGGVYYVSGSQVLNTGAQGSLLMGVAWDVTPLWVRIQDEPSDNLFYITRPEDFTSPVNSVIGAVILMK